jgi:hypothetical protein
VAASKAIDALVATGLRYLSWEGHSLAVDEFPNQSIPLIFADGVISQAYSPGIVKFYLGRNDPEIRGGSTANIVNVAQVVMPIAGFVATFVFFEQRLQMMIEGGLLNQADIDTARAALKGVSGAP